MHPDDKGGAGEQCPEFERDTEGESLDWLLEQDLTEPVDSLFSLSESGNGPCELTASEAAMASRPMFSSNASADDLSAFVEEEIVLSEDSGSDIYRVSGSGRAASDSRAPANSSPVMAIDHRRQGYVASSADSGLNDGLDVLGLTEEDDIGSQPVRVQRVRRAAGVVAEDDAIGPGASPGVTAGDAARHPHAADNTASVAVDVEVTLVAESGIEVEGAAPGAEADSEGGVAGERTCAAGPAAVSEPDETDRKARSSSLPVDEDAFDDYLLSGAVDDEHNFDIDSLDMETSDGAGSVDPALDSHLDYHQDFSLPEYFKPETVATLSAVLAPVMRELHAAVESRLETLSQAAGSVALDTMLAIDPLSRRQCVEEGYEPIVRVLPALPEAMGALDKEEQEALCVRLMLRKQGVCCNDLFQPDFCWPQTDMALELQPEQGPDHGFGVSSDVDLGSSATPDHLSLDGEPANDASAHDHAAPHGEVTPATPAEDFLGDGQDDDIDVWPDAEDASDDSELLALLDDFDSPAEGGTDSDDGAWPDEHGDVVSPDGTSLQAGEGIDPGEPHARSLAAEEEAEEQAPHIFSSEDLDDWDTEEHASAGVDVEQLLDTLVAGEAEIGDICGVAVDEFGSADAETGQPDRPAATPGVPAPDAAASASAALGGSGDLSWCIPSNIRFSTHSGTGGEVFRDFLDAFLDEAAVELEKLEDAIGQWEQDIDSVAGRDIVPRVLHTLKGIAKGVGLQCYGTLIHNFETLLLGLAKPAAGEEAIHFRIVNAWLDAAVQGFEHIRSTRTDVLSELPQAEGLVPPVKPMDAATAVAADSAVHSARHDDRVQPAQRQKDKQLADEGAKVLASQQTIRMSSEAVDRLLNLTNQSQQLGVRSSQSVFRSKRAGAELQARLSSVRSHITKIADRALANVTARGDHGADELDALEMDRYSELQEAASILREAIEDLDDLIRLSSRQTSAAEAFLKQQAAVINLLGSAVRDARVMPVSRLMPGLRRIVRTVGADLGKLVEFRVLNESGKLDRDSHVCCQIILEHMLRNALDHGIESPEQRRESGKPETGMVTIDVSKDGSDYLIRLSDDGRGMDPDALREVALDRGLDINPAQLSDRDALRLIFHKGFSTATRLSEISGRGVGMDIVLSELQQIGGEIDIESTPGEGTTFTVRVPSNINVNGALLVTAAEVAYAIPLDGLKAVERVASKVFYGAIGRGENLEINGLSCEPAYLATLCSGAKLPDPASWGSTLPVIIAGSEERYMAIAVDDVTEALELVIRSLGTQFSQVPGFAGAATTSDGQAIVAMDLNALVRSIASAEPSAVPFEREQTERLLVLVVDDSRTQRMVASSQFDSLGVETVMAENGMVAIDLLNSTPRLPDVVLLDVEMPVKDGIQTLREIRRSPRYQHLPVIMVTSRTGPKHRALAQEAGCNGYMGKPFNFPVLVEQIAQLTGYPLQIN